jgi:hypothetical protein
VQGLAEQPVEERASGSGLEGGPHLAEDLALPGHHRVEAGRDAEEVQRGGLVVEAIERSAGGLEHRRSARLRGRAVVPGDVELRPVARREADRLARVLREPAGHLGGTARIEGDPLPELDRSAVMRDADEPESRHEKWETGRPTRTRATSAKPARTR